jgi:hypothetical protein
MKNRVSLVFRRFLIAVAAGAGIASCIAYQAVAIREHQHAEPMPTGAGRPPGEKYAYCTR